MGLVAKITRPSIRASVAPADTQYAREAFQSSGSQSGRTVSVEASLGLDAVWSCVRCLSDAVGSLPLKTYRKAPQGGRVEDSDTRTYRMLHDEPNPEMSAIDVWSLGMVHVNTWGNFYLGKERIRGEVAALWPIRPDLVRVSRRNGQKLYQLRDGETLRLQDRVYTSDDIIHVMGFNLDGLMGLSPVSYHRETIGAGLAQDEFGNTFFANSALPRGVIEVEGELDDPAFTRFDKRWRASHQGRRNYHRVAILEAGAKFHPITMPLKDAQFVEQQGMTVQKVARIYRVPASMVGGDSGDSLKYSTVEGDAIHFERYSLSHWIARFEGALRRDRDLFPSRLAYPEFQREALLRGDMKTRAEVYAMALDPDTGWMDRPEVRELENLPPEKQDRVVRVRDEMAAIVAAAEKARTNGGAHVN